MATANKISDKTATKVIAEKADKSKKASRILSGLTREKKDKALNAIAQELDDHRQEIIRANQKDLEKGQNDHIGEGLLDRLKIDNTRIDEIISSISNVIGLPDPIGEIKNGQTLPNGLLLKQVHVPIGVVGVIYEARPNVTVDVSAISIKSGNAVILRGGSVAQETNKTLVKLIRQGLQKMKIPEDSVQTIDELGRPGATALMQARGKVDVLIPRGGRNLIQTTIKNATVPVIETGEGNVHVFVDESADKEKAFPVVINSKTHRTSVCNSAETLLIHKNFPDTSALIQELEKNGVKLHLDESAQALTPSVKSTLATETDWEKEYLDMEMAVKIVDSIDEAIEHIDRYSTGHTEAILTNNISNAADFTQRINSAAVIVNASTRFTDGGQLGLGTEIGISTQKMHSRGPMGLKDLTTTKWIVHGDGQIRQ